MPLTAAAPTVVPPLEQVVGALACGPKTVYVTVPAGLDPPDSLALIEFAAIAVPAVAVFGPFAFAVVVVVLTTVEVMLELLQVLVAELLLLSPP